ncbi:MAG: hypothetical protein Q9191_007440 [Dirinaria sp. TL-2023a]
MKQYLIGEDLWHFIDDSNQCTSKYSAHSAYTFNGKLIYIISICLSDDDQEDLANITTAKELWEALGGKYGENLPSSRKHLEDFIFYKKPADKTIDEAWAQVCEYGRKAATVSSDMAHLRTPVRCMQQLFASLGPDYRITVDAIVDTLDGSNATRETEDILQKLREKETQLKTEESTMVAKQAAKHKSSRSHHHQRGTYSDSNESHPSDSHSTKRHCYLCKGPHELKQCPMRSEFNAFRKWKRMEAKKPDSKVKADSKSKKHRAYDAETDPEFSEGVSDSERQRVMMLLEHFGSQPKLSKNENQTVVA